MHQPIGDGDAKLPVLRSTSESGVTQSPHVTRGASANTAVHLPLVSRLEEITPGTTTHNILNLAATTYYFSITAYNHEGVESTLSNEVAISLN